RSILPILFLAAPAACWAQGPLPAGLPSGGAVFEPAADGRSFAGFSGRVRIFADGFVLHPGGPPVRARLLGADAHAELVGAEPSTARSHYLADPDRRRVDVPRFDRVRVREAYPGIDVDYYPSGGGLEFDLIVAPG